MNKLIDADEAKKNLCLFCNYSESCELDNYKDKCITMQAIDKTNDQRIKLTEEEKVKYFDGGYNKGIDDAINTVKTYFYEAIDNGSDIFSKEDKDILTYNKHINERLEKLKGDSQ